MDASNFTENSNAVITFSVISSFSFLFSLAIFITIIIRRIQKKKIYSKLLEETYGIPVQPVKVIDDDNHPSKQDQASTPNGPDQV